MSTSPHKHKRKRDEGSDTETNTEAKNEIHEKTKKVKKRKKDTGTEKNFSTLTDSTGHYHEVTSPLLLTVPVSDKIEKRPDPIAHITKKDVRVQRKAEKSVDQSSGSELGSLVMKTGSVDELLGQGNTWPALADNLSKVFLPLQKDDEDPANYIANLCTIYYSQEKGREFVDLIRDPDILPKTEIKKTADFLDSFIMANGQLDYIQKQDWYRNGEYVIGIDVNYYPDRSVYQESLAFHKDTGGNNIFVNLIFDNKNPIEQTEWFADLAQPSKKRTDWQAGLLPQAYLADLDQSRDSLQDKYGKDQKVNGGSSGTVNTYLSWVDDLVWHATPVAGPRIEYSAAAAESAYGELDAATQSPNFTYESDQFRRNMYGGEILGTIAEAEGTDLHKWLARKKLKPRDLDIELAKQAWQELYGPQVSGGKKLFGDDAKKRENKGDWRITGESSEATAHDPRLQFEDSSIRETPVGLSSLRRVNSTNQLEIADLREANAGQPRSFIRTWLRVIRQDDMDEDKPDPDASQDDSEMTVHDPNTTEFDPETNNKDLDPLHNFDEERDLLSD
jgi:hypothetical protein